MKDVVNKFHHGDAFDIFPKVADKSIDLTFTSLPDISQGPWGKDIEQYQEFQNRSCDQMARITKDEGFVVISQTDRKINGEILPNHITYHQAMIRNGFKLKDYKIMVRNTPVEKRDMYYFNYQHTLVFTKKRDIQIADAVLELFRRADYIENFNKKHLYLLIREMTDCKTHYITKVVNVMKQHQKKMLNAFLEGEVIDENPNQFWNEEHQ